MLIGHFCQKKNLISSLVIRNMQRCFFSFITMNRLSFTSILKKTVAAKCNSMVGSEKESTENNIKKEHRAMLKHSARAGQSASAH